MIYIPSQAVTLWMEGGPGQCRNPSPVDSRSPPSGATRRPHRLPQRGAAGRSFATAGTATSGSARPGPVGAAEPITPVSSSHPPRSSTRRLSFPPGLGGQGGRTRSPLAPAPILHHPDPSATCSRDHVGTGSAGNPPPTPRAGAPTSRGADEPMVRDLFRLRRRDVCVHCRLDAE